MIDKFDKKILEILQDDAMLPITEIADKVGMSKSVCWRRINSLTEKGIIRSKVALLNAELLGLKVVVFANVKLARKGRHELEGFMKEIQKHTEVTECYTMMGGVDFLLKIVVKNVKQFEDFYWDILMQMDGVLETSSTIAMTEVKLTTKLPLDSIEIAP
ncbi:MAG: Lrp/AsnC family transcriptional regulator [Hyphomicrobiales bacterium]